MKLKREKKIIGDLEFDTSQFPAMLSFTLLAKVAKIVGPALGALQKLDPSTELSGVAMAGAFAGVDPKDATALIPEILSETAVYMDGKFIQLNSKSNIDLVFSGRLMVMFQVVGFVLQVNYGDFFEGSGLPAPQTLKPSEG